MKFIAEKLISFITTIIFVSLITFLAIQVLPGDPSLLILGTEGDPASREIIREQLGLNENIVVRYFKWIIGVFRGDLGQSIRYSVPVRDLISDALPLTLWLAFLAVILSLVISIPLGIGLAVKGGSVLDLLGFLIMQIGMSVPAFWIGILLIQLFAVKLQWLPPGGYGSFVSFILPVLALALPRAAVLTRVVRANMLDEFREDYLRTARSKGLPQGKVLYKHALRNVAISIFTVAGIHLTQLLVGTIVIEQVFSLPGLGQLLLAAVLQRDLPLVQGLVFIGAVLILTANLCFDFLIAALDPRVRFE